MGKGNDSAGTRYACPHVGNYFFGHSWRFAIYFEPLKALRRASFRATSNPGANVRFGSKADIRLM
jgi:hypothetical protein